MKTFDQALYKWFVKVREQEIPINGLALKEKALKYAEELGIDDFKASNGWFDRWKSRHEISFKTISGEALLAFILARWPVQFPVFQRAVDLFTIYQWFRT